jgi:N-acetylglucosamine malate deacetylase 1
MDPGGTTRRDWLRLSTSLVGIGIGLPLAGCAGGPEQAIPDRKLKVVAVGAHVDDAQAGCGGTMALYADRGHEVAALSLTHGDSESIARGLRMPEKELAARRSAEAVTSCDLLRARIRFLDEINGRTELSPASYERFSAALQEERPDVVFTHWPIDTHRDHRTASLLTYDAWLRGGKRFELYFYEVELGTQTQSFVPNHYVDITAVEARKRESCFANTVTIGSWWPMHETMHRGRGMEAGYQAAEAFIRPVNESVRRVR